MNDEDSHSPVDPAGIQPGPTSSISIDISKLLHSRASEPTRPVASRPDVTVDPTGTAGIAPLIALVSRSVDFALGILELPHFRILVLLSGQNSMSVAEIVTAMQMPSRRMLTLLDSMESAGWIYAAKRRRGVAESIAISAKGRELVDEVTVKRQQEIDEILQRVSQSTRLTIAKAFGTFATAAREPAIRHPRNGIAP